MHTHALARTADSQLDHALSTWPLLWRERIPSHDDIDHRLVRREVVLAVKARGSRLAVVAIDRFERLLAIARHQPSFRELVGALDDHGAPRSPGRIRPSREPGAQARTIEADVHDSP
jgi:hypothetical protein